MKLTLKRSCPTCGKCITYKHKQSHARAQQINTACRACKEPTYYPTNKGDLSVLMNETPEAYYWMGFLLADGHFSKRNLIKVALASKDEDHLKRLQKFLSIPNMQTEKAGQSVSIKTMDTRVVPLIVDKFNISNKKTYNPPNLSFIKDRNLLLSLIIGFIDGDGCIVKKGKAFSLNIHCHRAWLKNINMFAKTINPTSKAKIRADGYASVSITNNESLKSLKRLAQTFNLPIMSRKWDKVDLDFIPYQEQRMRQFKQLKKNISKYLELPWFDEELKKFISSKIQVNA